IASFCARSDDEVKTNAISKLKCNICFIMCLIFVATKVQKLADKNQPLLSTIECAVVKTQ
ncbi:MAG: hypothetical protein IKA38_02600, partial [Alistipes sp.]|nr:hypothetical protein [Alistipes sp.]